MADRIEPSEARERVLAAAERLFAQKGYAAVTLRDIAAAVGIRHASLYHHAPGGKEDLFVEVTERSLGRHRAGLEAAIGAAAGDIRAQLLAAAAWLLAEPPMDLIRMIHSDLPAISAVHAERLNQQTYDSMIAPLEAALERARRAGEISHRNLGLVAGGLLGMVESLHAAPANLEDLTHDLMARDLIDVLLNGLRPR